MSQYLIGVDPTRDMDGKEKEEKDAAENSLGLLPELHLSNVRGSPTLRKPGSLALMVLAGVIKDDMERFRSDRKSFFTIQKRSNFG